MSDEQLDPGDDLAPLPVRVVSQQIGDYLGRLGAVWVEGEVAEVTLRPGSAMAFIRLKDTSADISLQLTCHRSLLENGEPKHNKNINSPTEMFSPTQMLLLELQRFFDRWNRFHTPPFGGGGRGHRRLLDMNRNRFSRYMTSSLTGITKHLLILLHVYNP